MTAKKMHLMIQEAFPSPKALCKYMQVFFYMVSNNFFTYGFLGTSYVLWV